MKMEEIEYLEEYEDIVIRNSAINLGGAEDSKTPKPHEYKDDDGSSSSLDQDIFNCLFDDNSEDDNEEQQPKRDMPKPDQQRELRASLDSIDLINDLGEQVAKEFEISKAAAGQTKDTINSENNSSVTSNAKSCVRVNTLKKLPKVKETLTKKVVIPRKLNVINEKPEKTRNLSTTISLLSDKPRTKSLSKVGHLPTTSNVLKRSIVSKTSSVKQRPATIVKPEKIITKDPPEDPLNLDEISSTESANFSSVSDITGETYNSVSEFDDDDYDFTSHIENLEEDEESSNSQIIDISNDSSGSRSQFEFLRGSTPSPVVSEDRDMHSLPGTSKGRTSPKLMANHEIIKNLMKKEGRPKLLQLINEQEHLSKGCQKESIDDSKTGAPSSGGSPKPRDIESADSHDSYLSVVNEMLEESYAEAMKNSKHETMANQEVGAEMEISIEETTETSNLTDKADVICAVKNEQAKKSNMVANPIRDSGKESDKTKGQSEIKQTETVLKPQSITSMVSEKITSTTPNQEKNKSAVHSANDERRTDRSIKSLGEKDENTNKKESKVPDFKADKDFTLDECGFQGFAEDINKMTEEASKEIQEPSSSNKSERHNKLPDNQEKTKIILANTTQLRETDFDNNKLSQSGEEASIEIQKPAFSKTSETHKKLSEKQVILENTTQLRGKDLDNNKKSQSGEEASREIQKSAISKKAETQGNLPENQDKSKKILVNKVQLRETNIDNNKKSQPKVSQDVSKITIRNPFVHRKVKNISTKDKIERTSTGSIKTPEKCPSADTIEATNEKSHLTKPNNTERRSTGNSEIVLKNDCHTLKHITVADKIKAVESPACSKAHQKNTKTFTKKLEKTSKKPCATVENEMIGFGLKERKPNEAYKSQHAKENESKELSRDSEDKVENTSSEKLEVLTKAPNLRNLNCSKMEVPKTVLEINTEEKRTSDNNPRNMVQIKDNKSTATDKSNKSEEDAVIKNMTEIAKLNPDEPQETDVPIKALKAPVCQLSDSNSTSNQSETILKNQLPSHKNNNDQHSAVEYAKPVNAQGNKLAEPIEKRPTLSKKECSTNSRDSDNKTDGTSQVVVTESKEKVMNKPFQVEINKVVDFESILVDNGEKQQSPDNRNTQDSPKGLDRTAIVKQIDQSKKSDHDTVNLKRNIRKIRSTTKQGSEELKETPKLQKPHDPSTDKNEDLAKCSPRKKKAANVLTGSEIMKDVEHLSITASESDSRGNTGKTPERVTSTNNKRARKANDNKEDALSKNRKNIVDFAESNSVKNIEDNIASPNLENVKRIKKQMEAMVEVPKSLKEKYDEASGSSNKHKISSSTNAALSSSSTESERKESLSDKQNINVGKGSHKSKKCEGFSDVVVEKKSSSREATSVDPMMDAQDANYKEYPVDNISEKVLPKQDIQKGESSLPEQQGNDEESLSKKKNEGVDQVRTLRKRALDTSTNESKNIELPKEPHADLEINKKRTLRSPAQKPANELAKRTKLDRSARMRNVATVKTPPIVTEPSPNSGVIIDAPSQHPISEQIKASLTTATSSNMASMAVGILRDSDTEQSITEIPKIVPEIKPGTENRSDTSLKAKSADNASPTKKVILSEKKRTKHSTKKNISDNIIPSSVLSFAEWLDKNKKVEPTEDKHIEDMNNCKSRKSAKTKGALSKHGIEIEDPEKRPHTIHGKKREHKQTPPEARLQNIDLAQDEKNSFAHKGGTCQTSSSRSRSRLKRRTIGNAQQTLNSRQQVDVVRPSSASPTKGDKNKKRTEIEKLIESMSKEMKDGGIEDLLNSSDHVKRQRAASKKNTSTDLATAPERSLAGKINSAGNKGNSICEFASKSSPIRPAMLDTKFKKPIAPKELNLYAVNNDSVLSIETEKALIDEIEIVNMNSNFLKPLKCVAPKELHQNETKNNKLGKTHTLSNKSAQAMICRKLKVRINRRFVTKYMQSLEKDKVSEVLMQKGSGKHVKKKGAEHSAPLVVQKDRQSDVRVQTTAEMPVNCGEYIPSSTSVPQSAQGSVKEGNLPTILPHIQHSPHVVESTNENSRNASCINRNLLLDPVIPVELKHEFLDETPGGPQGCILPDTPTLIARSHSITQAAANALANTALPTDIRLLTNDPLTSIHVPSFGVTPTLIDAKGTRMYTFLHPAKYSRNHSNVLLDYCCPNLDGPMPAIDPTRIHAQVQTPVVELPAFIVLTTKVVTRAELESNSTAIPEVIRKKAEKLRSSIANQHVQPTPSGKALAVAPAAGFVSEHGRTNQMQQQMSHPTQSTSAPLMMKPTHLPPGPHLSPAINALTKYLPSTTTITPKIRPALPQPPLSIALPQAKSSPTTSISVVHKGSDLLTDMQLDLLRSNLRRFDVIFKKLAQPFDKLSFIERHHIIENIIKSGKFLPKDLDWSIVLMEEYLKQVNSMTQREIAPINDANANSTATTNPLPHIQMTPLTAAQNSVVVPKSSVFNTNAPCRQKEIESHQKAELRKQQSSSSSKTLNTGANMPNIRKRQVPIYDTEKNIIGYQLQVITPTSSATSSSKEMVRRSEGNPTTTEERKATKRPAQGSPQIFYATPPLQTSTPQSHLRPVAFNVPQESFKKAGSSAQHHGSIVTTLRSAGSATTGTETITTTTTMEVKRVTRSRAAGSKIIIMSKSNNNEEAILPDVSHRTEIKSEQDDVNEFVG